MKRSAFLLLLLLLAARGFANDILIYSGTVKRETFDATGTASITLPCYVIFDFTDGKFYLLQIFRAQKLADATRFSVTARYKFPATGSKRREFIFVDGPAGLSNPTFLRFRGTTAPKTVPVASVTQAEVSRTLAFTASFKDGQYLLYELAGSLSFQQELTLSANDANLALDDTETLVLDYLIRRKIITP